MYSHTGYCINSLLNHEGRGSAKELVFPQLLTECYGWNRNSGL